MSRFPGERFLTFMLGALLCGCGSAPPDSAAVPDADSGEVLVPARTETVESAVPAARPDQGERGEPEKKDTASERAASSPAPAAESVAETVFRPADSRPIHDDARAAELGVHRYESTHLLLYTDIEPAVAETLPPLMDQAYAALVDYFGPLPPDRQGAEFQMTGYLIREKDRFREAGMLPEAVDTFIHGRHVGAQFWMNDQTESYYRRHLLIHEGTHCYMLFVPGTRPPLWYLEGMAEFFGTHTINDAGQAAFGVMPAEREKFIGFGRIDLVREAVDAGRFQSVADVSAFDGGDFAGAKADMYAWSWAFCKFLDAHPRYRERFRALAAHITEQEFYRLLQESFAADMPALWIEWEQFARHLQFGFDIERAAVEFRKGTPLAADELREAPIQADAGWQSSGVWVEAGRTYAITAAGRVALAQEPKPWESEAQGISIRYSEGRPIGRLLAAVQSDEPPDEAGNGSLEAVIDAGPFRLLTPAVNGTLYLRVNDFWSEPADNTGTYRVTIEAK